MLFQVLIHPQRVERSRVKSRQEHIDDDQQIYFPLFRSLRQVFIVVLELVLRRIKAGVEDRVIIQNCGVKEIS